LKQLLLKDLNKREIYQARPAYLPSRKLPPATKTSSITPARGFGICALLVIALRKNKPKNVAPAATALPTIAPVTILLPAAL
jgi:hypothetical protein